MAAPRYIADSSGLLTEIAAVQTGGSGNADRIPALNATTGLLDITMMPVGIGAEVTTCVTVSGCSAGHFMYFYDLPGLRTDKAIATSATTAAMGFVLSTFAALASATVYGISNTNNTVPVVTMTIGGRYYLSNSTAGQVATYGSMTLSAGHIVQRLGIATVAGPPGSLVFDNADFYVKA